MSLVKRMSAVAAAGALVGTSFIGVSLAAPAAMAAPRPPAPSSITVVAPAPDAPNGFDVSWGSSKNATGYQVSYNIDLKGELVGDLVDVVKNVPANTTSLQNVTKTTKGGLAPLADVTRGCFKVRAFNGPAKHRNYSGWRPSSGYTCAPGQAQQPQQPQQPKACIPRGKLYFLATGGGPGSCSTPSAWCVYGPPTPNTLKWWNPLNNERPDNLCPD